MVFRVFVSMCSLAVLCACSAALSTSVDSNASAALELTTTASPSSRKQPPGFGGGSRDEPGEAAPEAEAARTEVSDATRAAIDVVRSWVDSFGMVCGTDRLSFGDRFAREVECLDGSSGATLAESGDYFEGAMTDGYDSLRWRQRVGDPVVRSASETEVVVVVNFAELMEMDLSGPVPMVGQRAFVVRRPSASAPWKIAAEFTERGACTPQLREAFSGVRVPAELQACGRQVSRCNTEEAACAQGFGACVAGLFMDASVPWSWDMSCISPVSELDPAPQSECELVEPARQRRRCDTCYSECLQQTPSGWDHDMGEYPTDCGMFCRDRFATYE